MKKTILTIAIVIASQSSLAGILAPSGILNIVGGDKSGAAAAITGDLAQAIYDNMTSLVPAPDAKRNDQFFCGIAFAGMSCVTALKDLTALEDSAITVSSLFNTDDGSVIISFSGSDAAKVYDGMENVQEFMPGFKMGTEFVCRKAEKVEDSMCLLAFDINRKPAPNLSQTIK